MSCPVGRSLYQPYSVTGLPAIARVTGFPVQQAGAGLTMNITPQAVGDILLVGVVVTGGTTPTIASVSGGGATGWQSARNFTNGGVVTAMWWATATTVGSAQTVVVAGTGLSGANLRISADSYRASGVGGATWTLDVAGNATQTATAVTFPALTSSSSTSQGLYWGVAFATNGFVAGATTGFGYELNSFSDGGIAHNTTVVASTTYTPTSGVHGTAAVDDSAAAIFKLVNIAASTITRATGFPSLQAGTGLTISVTPQTLGDLLVVGVTVTGTFAPTITSVSGGGAIGWTHISPGLLDGGVLSDVWWAKATTVGSPQTITVAGTNLTGTGIFVRIAVDSYTSSSTGWAVDVSATAASTSATLTAFPSLTTTGNPAELYWGIGFLSSGFTAGATAGFGYEVNSFSDGGITHDNTLAAATAYAPTSGTGVAGHAVSSGVIFKLTSGVTSRTAVVDLIIGGVAVVKPLKFSKVGVMTTATSIVVGTGGGSGGGGGTTGGTNVNKVPTGPTVPAGGWTVIAADGFDNGHSLSQLWGPNVNNNGGTGYTNNIPVGTANTGEVVTYNASQVQLQSDGLHLPMVYSANVGGPGLWTTFNYLSGAIISQQFISGEPGQRGFPITGFRWLPSTSAIWCFESLITMPPFDNPGQDPGWWCSTPSWLGEIDFVEMWGYGVLPYGYGVTWIYVTPNSLVQKTAYGDSVQTDGHQHRWTHVFDGPARRVEVYIDGGHRTDLSFAWPPSFSPTPLYMVITHGIRNVYGTPPTWTTGTKDMIIRSVAVYASGSGLNYTGGLIAPGTNLV